MYNLAQKRQAQVPAYSELKEGMLKCSKDRKHTMVVDAFSMLETVVVNPQPATEMQRERVFFDNLLETVVVNPQPATEMQRERVLY